MSCGFSIEAQQIMNNRFGKDVMVALATVSEEGIPSVRGVNAYYRDRAFYMVTYRKSNKIRDIQHSPNVAISGEWLSAHGIAEDMGHVLKEENQAIMEVLRREFSSWYDASHVDESDPDVILLCVWLTDGILFSNGIKYVIDFKSV